MIDNVIRLDYESDEERAHWECECGAGGSAPSDRADIAAEKHVREGESVSYRYPAR